VFESPETDILVIFPGSRVVQTGDSFVNWEVPGFPAIDQDTNGSGGVQGEIALAEYILSNAPDDVKIIPGHGVLASKGDLAKELARLQEASVHWVDYPIIVVPPHLSERWCG